MVDAALAEAEKYRQTVGWTDGRLYEWTDPALYAGEPRSAVEEVSLASQGRASKACLVGVLLVGARRAGADAATVERAVAACLPAGAHPASGPSSADPSTSCSTWNDVICTSAEEVDELLAAARQRLAHADSGKP